MTKRYHKTMCGLFPLYLFSVFFFIAIKTGITEMKLARFEKNYEGCFLDVICRTL